MSRINERKTIIVFLSVIIPFLAVSASVEKNGRKAKIESGHKEAPKDFCSSSVPGKMEPRYHVHMRHPRSAGYRNDNGRQLKNNRYGTAFYFTGLESGLRLTAANQIERSSPLLPRLEFTVEIWAKAEGGQPNPAVILGQFSGVARGGPGGRSAPNPVAASPQECSWGLRPQTPAAGSRPQPPS